MSSFFRGCYLSSAISLGNSLIRASWATAGCRLWGAHRDSRCLYHLEPTEAFRGYRLGETGGPTGRRKAWRRTCRRQLLQSIRVTDKPVDEITGVAFLGKSRAFYNRQRSHPAQIKEVRSGGPQCGRKGFPETVKAVPVPSASRGEPGVGRAMPTPAHSGTPASGGQSALGTGARSRYQPALSRKTANR